MREETESRIDHRSPARDITGKCELRKHEAILHRGFRENVFIFVDYERLFVSLYELSGVPLLAAGKGETEVPCNLLIDWPFHFGPF